MKIKYREVSDGMKEKSMPSFTTTSEQSKRSSLNSTIEVVEHYNIDIEKLIPYSKQARKVFNQEDIKSLAESIEKFGLRQPLTIIRSEKNNGFFEVVSGERRLLACRLVNMKKVPCVLLKDDKNAEEIALIENIQRSDLTPLEMGEAFQTFLNEKVGMTQVELGRIIGVSSKMISEKVSLAKLPVEVKDYIKSNNITDRKILRRFVASKNPIEIINSLSNKNSLSKEKQQSILRIFKENGVFVSQNKQLQFLTVEEKMRLKEYLNQIISNL